MQTVHLTGGPAEGNQTYNTLYIKGETDVTFNFASLALDNTIVSRIQIDYGDGSAIEYKNYKVENDHINTPITYNFARYNTFLISTGADHTFKFDESHYPVEDNNIDYGAITAQILVRYSDYREVLHSIPINIYKDSYYDTLGDVSIINTQLTDTTNNNVFCIVETESGDVINIVLS